MRRFPLVLLAALLWAARALAGADDAVVRVPSHGASATVIHTEKGRSLILGCAHAYERGGRDKAMSIDVPFAQAGQARQVVIRLLAVDYQADLSLVELQDGPLPNVAPVAPAGWRPTHQVLACGYDEMKWPAQKRPTSILHDDGRGMWWTRERPWHGRSGGGLIDMQTGQLVGVCHGYTGPPNHREVQQGGQGLYVSLDAIHRFLARYQPALVQGGRQPPIRADPRDLAPPPPSYYPQPLTRPAPQCPS